eukprot:gene7583-8423_t
MISALDFENEYVHTAYEQLAQHHIEQFAPNHWSFVDEFVQEFPVGSILLDVGCGKGKYLRQISQSFMIGCDRSSSLSDIACSRGNEIATCDITCMPFDDAKFDGIICISVIHHLATEARRVKALNELSRMLRPGGRLLITGWALENKYRKFNCRDVLVPAELTTTHHNSKDENLKSANHGTAANRTLDFLCHHASRLTTKINKVHSLFCEELESLKSKLHAASNVTDTIQHYVVHRKRSLWLWVEDRAVLSKLGHLFRTQVIRRTRSSNDIPSLQQQQQQQQQKEEYYHHHHNHDYRQCHVAATPNEDEKDDDDYDDVGEGKTNYNLHRYYHVFQKDEIPNLIENHVDKLQVIDETFAQGNWVVYAKKLKHAQ